MKPNSIIHSTNFLFPLSFLLILTSPFSIIHSNLLALFIPTKHDIFLINLNIFTAHNYNNTIINTTYNPDTFRTSSNLYTPTLSTLTINLLNSWFNYSFRFSTQSTFFQNLFVIHS